MGLDFADTPAEVDDLHDVLLSEGFEVAEEVRGRMGGLQVTLRGPVPSSHDREVAEVQISSDRGQWTVALRFVGMSRFIDPRVWAAYLDDSEVGEPSVAEQARFVATRITDAADAVSGGKGVESELVRIGADYMRRQLGD